MELKILDRIKEDYKNIILDVEFIDFRIYKITILNIGTNQMSEFNYQYNVNFTFDYNISIIEYKIDKILLSMYKKGGLLCQI